MSKKNIRKICVVLVDRANYGRMKPVMRSICEHPDLELQVICAGTMVLERFSEPANNVEKDGFDVSSRIYIELEGSVPISMAKSIGFAVIEFSSEYHRLKPDVVLVIGDRYETLGATIAAVYQNICVAHIQGGEVSGSLDEVTRHAITKFSHFHFPATRRAAEYLVRMGERPDTILTVGCPSSDIAESLDRGITVDMINSGGRGCKINPSNPYILVVFHPNTTEFGAEESQMSNVLEGLGRVALQTILLWPNIDAGSDRISKVIRRFEHKFDGLKWIHNATNYSPENYLRILAAASCAVGNSSSFIRDASFFGTPIVLVGDRQEGREFDEHVTQVIPQPGEIENEIRRQLRHGRYQKSKLYGEGGVSNKIADALSSAEIYLQKRLNYVYEK